MTIEVRTLKYLEYIAVLNQVTNKLVVFEEVFSEYVKTAKYIITGKALVDEDLPSLQKYFSHNLQELKHFTKIVLDLPVENECLELRKSLNNSFQQYILATKKLYRVINQDNSENYQEIMECRKKQRLQVLHISQILVSGAQLPQDRVV